jgi:hypothetical protein
MGVAICMVLYATQLAMNFTNHNVVSTTRLEPSSYSKAIVNNTFQINITLGGFNNYTTALKNGTLGACPQALLVTLY